MRRQWPMVVLVVVLTSRTSFSQGLGGYGSTASSMPGGMGTGGALVIPYGGMFQGFMPARMGGASRVAFKPRATDGLMAQRQPRPMNASLGMGKSTGMSANDRTIKTNARMLVPASYGPSLGTGAGAMGPARSMGVMPPNLGSPFRPPTPFAASSTSFMSM